MERLTDEHKLGAFASLKDKKLAQVGAFKDYETFYAVKIAINKLYEYENFMKKNGFESLKDLQQICMDSRDLNELEKENAKLKSELEELKHNSIVPKFKVGDNAYAFTDHFAYYSNDEVKIKDIKLTYICQNDTESITYKEQSLFKTKQEAEEALKKLEGKNNGD